MNRRGFRNMNDRAKKVVVGRAELIGYTMGALVVSVFGFGFWEIVRVLVEWLCTTEPGFTSGFRSAALAATMVFTLNAVRRALEKKETEEVADEVLETVNKLKTQIDDLEEWRDYHS